MSGVDGAATAAYSRLSRSGPTTTSTRFYQGLGAGPDTVLNWVVSTFVLLYYNRILGLDGFLVSLALGAAVIADAVFDPLLASFSDNLRTRWGRRHPLMLVGALGVGAAFYPVFMPPAGLGQTALVLWLFVFMLASRLLMATFFIPWAAIASELSDDYVERTSIMSWRYAVGWTIGVGFPVLVFGALMPVGADGTLGQLNRDNYPAMALAAAILMTSLGVLTTVLTRREIPYLRQHAAPAPTTTAFASGLRRALGEFLVALGNRHFALLFMAVLLSSVIGGTTMNLGLYMTTFFWHLNPNDLRWFPLSAVGAVLAFPLVAHIQSRWDKKQILLICSCLSLLDGLAPVALRLLNLLPANGDPMLIVVLVSMGVLGAGIAVVQGITGSSMIADVLDDQELRTGLRQEAMFSAALAFSGKAASGIGMALGGLLVFAVALPQGDATGQIDGEAARRLGLVVGLLLPLLYVLPILLVSRYGLTRARHDEIRAALGRR